MNRLGIKKNTLYYQKLKPSQYAIVELSATNDFIASSIRHVIGELGLEVDFDWEFINYGDMQMVFAVFLGPSLTPQYVALVNQPAIGLGAVEKEYNNLVLLAKKHPEYVVEPAVYLRGEEREMYLAPYLYQARCIASVDDGWGIYVPEPEYRFVHFNSGESTIVNEAIIGLLVKMFDEDKNHGLACCRIGGGDFILEKAWDETARDIKSTLKHMKLIAAREFINTDLKKYLDLIREEFSKRTYFKYEKERDTSILINHQCRFPMKEEEIEKGIKLGLNLRKE